MIIHELKPLVAKVGDKLKNYKRPSEIYTVDEITPYGGCAYNKTHGKGIVIPYDIFGIVSVYSIERKIKLAYTNKLIRLIPI